MTRSTQKRLTFGQVFLITIVSSLPWVVVAILLPAKEVFVVYFTALAVVTIVGWFRHRHIS